MGKKRSGHKKAAKTRDLSARKGANVKGGWSWGLGQAVNGIGDALATAARKS
jgi:hypothetical protein